MLKMESVIEREPEKASKWRTEEVDAAVTFDELVQRAEQPAQLQLLLALAAVQEPVVVEIRGLLLPPLDKSLLNNRGASMQLSG